MEKPMSPSGSDSPADPPARGGDTPEAEFSRERRAALDLRRTDQDRTLAAVHALEAALAAAAPGREGTWHDHVRAALDVLREATAEEEHNATEPDSLLSDVARTQSRLRTRVRGLRAQYRQVRTTIDTLRHELGATDIDPDVADLRQRLAWLLVSLRHQRARESDLIYEAYYDAFNRELEQDARQP
jgi:chromosome segregation ATPase